MPVPDEWKSIRFTWGSEATEIRIPEKVLALPLTEQASKRKSDLSKTSEPVPAAPLKFTELVRTQILTNTIGLENAAQRTGLSAKTLKRKLLQANTSYSEIVDQLRLELAQSKLKNSETPIHAIARELGYEHHANFTRAFKRLSGITPQEYRNRMAP